MTPNDLAFVAELTRQQAGVIIRADKSFFVETRLGPIARREALESVAELIDRVRNTDDATLTRQIVAATLVQDTSFFRDRATFARLQESVIPTLASRDKAPIRLLSAGCATGQEAYTLAMVALESLAPPRIDIVAIDFSAQALMKAETGVYSHFEVQRGLPIRSLLRHFEQADDHWKTRPDLRQSIRWGEHNLLDDLTPLGEFDIVVCSHVLSAFEPAAAAATLDRLDAVCRDDGFMVFGANESVSPPAAFASTPTPGVWRRSSAFPRVSSAG